MTKGEGYKEWHFSCMPVAAFYFSSSHCSLEGSLRDASIPRLIAPGVCERNELVLDPENPEKSRIKIPRSSEMS